MKDGQDFSPFGMFAGAFAMMPDAIMRATGLSFAAKVVWARLAQYGGRAGDAYPKHATLAAEVGLEQRSLPRVLNELRDYGLIRIVQATGNARLRHAPNHYKFLWHKIFEESGTCEEGKNTSDYAGEKVPDYAGERSPIEKNSIEKKLLESAAPSTLRQFTDLFCSLWERHYGTKYPFTSKDGIIAAAIWKLLGTPQEAENVLHAYFACRGKFYKGHPMRLLRSGLPQFMADSAPHTEVDPKWLKRAKEWLKETKLPVEAEACAELFQEVSGWTTEVVDVLVGQLIHNKVVQNKQLKKTGRYTRRTTDVQEGTLELITGTSGAFYIRYGAWIAREVENWDRWEGGLDAFRVGEKHWARFLTWLWKQNDWTLSKGDREILNAATESIRRA